MLTLSKISLVLLVCICIPGFALAQKKADNLGVGMVTPHVAVGETLRFYSEPGFEQSPDAMKPIDSVGFKQGEFNIEIRYAPPWLSPEVLNLGYDLFMMRARTLRRDWIEVVVNQKTGETRWVARNAVSFSEWPTFLLTMAAVEVIDPKVNPVRSTPDDRGAVVLAKRASLHPLEIRGSWMRVSTSEPGDPIVPTGWIRWREGDRLVVEFSPMS